MRSPDIRNELKEAIASFVQKMPKSDHQRNTWIAQREEELFKEFAECGIDAYSIIGMLEILKDRLLSQHQHGKAVVEAIIASDEPDNTEVNYYG